MPANLNALIRYKEIDTCLKNKYEKCTLRRLQEACSEALGEKRGIYKKVSKRTIQDDIRVMRSDILGFNAPIEVDSGVYYYADEEYSIFDIPLSQEKLLKEVLEILLKDNRFAKDEELESLTIRISRLLGVETIEYNMCKKSIINLESNQFEDLESDEESFPDIRFMNKGPAEDQGEYIREYDGLKWQDVFQAI